MTGKFKIVCEGSGTFETGSLTDADAIGRQLVQALQAAGQTVNKAVLEIVTIVELDLTVPAALASQRL